MGLRYLLLLLTVGSCLWEIKASSQRLKRQAANSFPSQPSEPRAYQPPIPLGAPSIPVASSATLQNSYQPPIALLRSNEYQSPLNAPRTYQSPPVPGHGSQTYVISNQPQNQPRSVQYIPPSIQSGNSQQSFSVLQRPAPNSVPQPATSFSVHQQPAQSFPILSDNSGLPHSTAERTYSTHSKVVESHVPAQAIHKAPASEIQSDKGPAAKEKDNKNDEYVVYYYYYYDNDTAANNLSLNFDDIPSLEAYDNDKLAKDAEKSASARTLAANVNALAPVAAKPEKDAAGQTESISSQPRSVGDAYSRPNSHSQDDSLVQPLKPVSNVFRYGSNEVPRFPVLPNFIVTEVPTTVKSEIATPSLTTVSPVTQPALVNAQPDLKTGDETDDDLNNVLDHTNDNKAVDDKIAEEEPTTTTTTTTTEPPTTTEEPTTTTEKPRRSRPSFGGGNRRRFNPSPSSSPSSSFSSSRRAQTQSRSSTSTTTTTSTTSAPTRRSFQGSSRIRPRPPIGSNRPRVGSRTSEANEDKSESRPVESTTTSTTTSRSRFTSASPRRFQSSRSRSQTTSSTTSTTSTTRAPSSGLSSRSKPSTRPRPNLISRNRPARPGFPRPRPGSEPEEPETTTTSAPPTEEEISPETANDELPSTNEESNETEEDNETSAEETEEPTTTEGNRFSALFRPRNRNALGNRPRPVIGNRPPRS